MSPTLHGPRRALERRRNRALGLPNADGSPLEGIVDVPQPNDELDRVFVASGWHTWDREPVGAVAFELDGRVVGATRRNLVRRDDVVALRDDEQYAGAGWIAELDLRGVSSSTARLVPIVFPGVDHPGVRLDAITVRLHGDATLDHDGVPLVVPEVVHGNVDLPADGSTIELGPLLVKGWAHATTAPITHVDLRANGVELGRARLGLDRRDVALVDDATDAPVCGFEQLVDLSGLDPRARTVSLRATAVALNGLCTELAVELDVAQGEVTMSDRRVLPRLGGTTEVHRTRSGELDLLVVTHDLGYGGAQLWLLEALRQMRAGKDFPCTLVAFRAGPLTGALEALGIEVHVSTPLPVEDLAAYEGRLTELSAWLDTRQHSVVLANTFRAFSVVDLAQRRGLPVVWGIHESWPEPLIWAFDHPGVLVDPVVRASAARALANANAVVFESESTRSLYEARAPGRTVFVPYGVDTAALDAIEAASSRDEARRRLGLPEKGRVLLSMGTIEPRKGQTMLAEAFATIADAHPDARLVFVGDLDTAYSAGLRDFVARAGLEGRVRIEGVTSDAASWYLASDVLVCASDVESLPRSVLDAMCLGLPVVATAVFGNAELLDDGVTGLLFEPNDVASAARALDRALSMPPVWLGQIAARGRALVHEEHDASGYAADVLALLRGMLEDPSTPPHRLLTDRGDTGRALPHRLSA